MSIKKEFSKRDTNIVKGIAIILMLIHHCFLSPNRYKGQTVIFDLFTEQQFNAIALSFKICVALFVFLTGYGLTISLQKKEHSGELNAKAIQDATISRLIKLLSGFIFLFVLVHLWSLFVVRDGRIISVYNKKGPALGILYFLIDMFGLAEMFRTPTFLATFWYMSLAILLIFLHPILYSFQKKYGNIIFLFFALFVSILLPTTNDIRYCYLPDYVFPFAVGICSAKDNWIMKLSDSKFLESNFLLKTLKAILWICCIGILLFYRQKTRSTELLALWDGIIALFLISFSYKYIHKIPVLNEMLHFIGLHSMNIFLFHNFVRIVWYYDFTYSFQHVSLIIIVLLVISTIVAYVMDLLKEYSGYNALTQKFIHQVTK